MKPSEILRAARKKIERPEAWAQAEYAFREPTESERQMHEEEVAECGYDGCDDLKPFTCDPNDPKAVCWCASGAVCCVAGVDSTDAEAMPSDGDHAIRLLASAVLPGWEKALVPAHRSSKPVVVATNTIAVWNDSPGRTHEDVLAAFDRAIALAEAGE